VKLARTSIQDPSGCCTFQMPLVYNRVCWVSFDAATDFLVLKMCLAALGIFRGIFLVPGGRPAGFCVVLGSGEARGGSFGVTKPKRDILVAI
jgi:hypothetical protein